MCIRDRSLAPLLLDESEWQERPVILDMFEVDSDTGLFRGFIEVVDGRWGASLQINPDSDLSPRERRSAPLLLFDLWNDPMCLDSLHEERPDLVAKYTALLEQKWREHQRLGEKFTRSEELPLTSEQLRTLRALGYV